MSRSKPRLMAIVAAILFAVAIHPAYALFVPLASTDNVPFLVTYPEPARQQVRTALKAENSKLIDGHASNGISILHFRGNTTAMNEMLRRLADCSNATVNVSFQTWDKPCDWKIIYNAGSMNFQAIVNLKSEHIILEHIAIPAAKGPELKR